MIRRIFLYSISSLLILSATLNVASAAIIKVTTFNDITDARYCSLRDAIQASSNKRPISGCIAGEKNFTDTIQLPAGTYTLTRGELVVSGAMNIEGDSAIDFFGTNPLTGAQPARLPLNTTIVASGSRIFNTSESLSSLNLSNLILNGGTANNTSGGNSGYGGSILAGGPVSLSRVQINNASAAVSGGAIHIEGKDSTLTAIEVSFTGNNAPLGAVLSMSCFDNLAPTVRTFTLAQISVTGNGSATTSSIFDFCGKVTASIKASTIAKNTTSNTPGSSVISMVGDSSTRLNILSTLDLASNTITENNTAVALLYGVTSGLNLTNNIIAFNSAADCQYQGAPDPVTLLQPRGTVAVKNLFASIAGTAATSRCVLSPSSGSTDSNIYANATQLLPTYLHPLGLYGGSDLLGYLPVTGSALLNAGASTEVCGAIDQRSVTRGSGVQVTATSAPGIKCDIGALELSTLTANDDLSGSNSSYADVVNTVANTTRATPAEAIRLKRLNDDYIAAYKTSYRYRQAVMSVTTNDIAQENVTGSASSLDLLTDAAKYAITFTGTSSPNIHCEWNADMKQLLASRNDGTTTPGGTRDSCTYKITEIANPSNTSSANASFTINSRLPIAKDFNVTLPYGAASIPLNILANASDDANGPVGSVSYPNVVINGVTKPKPVFYLDVSTEIPVNIIIVKKPTQGRIVAEFEAQCASNDVNREPETCYGGKLTYLNNNLNSPFNDSFTYKVLNYDAAQSNIATVRIINTANTSDKTKSGAGSLGLGALFGLIFLVLMRRQKFI
jgi:hypothetical protein